MCVEVQNIQFQYNRMRYMNEFPRGVKIISNVLKSNPCTHNFFYFEAVKILQVQSKVLIHYSTISHVLSVEKKRVSLIWKEEGMLLGN